MPPMAATPRRSLLLFVIAALGAVGVFIVPWFVPVGSTPVVSDSYMVGFANWAAVAALLVTAMALAAVSARWQTAPLSAAGPLWRSGPAGRRRFSLIVVLALATLSLVTGASLVWVTQGVAWGETGFFLGHMAQLAAGYRPFLDFAYGYALAGIYAPVSLWHLFNAHGLSPLAAYYVVYFVLAVCSYWFFYVFVRRFALSDRQCALILLCLGLPTVVNLTLGIQYLLVRYLAAPIALVTLHAWLSWPRARGRWMRPLGAAVIALGGLAMTIVFASPEMVIALFVASLCYFCVLWSQERRTTLVALAAYLGCLSPLALLGHGYFSLVASFGTGAFNFPVLPGPPAVFYLFAVVIVAILSPPVFRATSTVDRPLTAAAIALGAALVPAALGRADAGHMFLNGLIVFILAAVFLARLRQRLFVPFLVGVAVVFCAVAYIYDTQTMKYTFLQAVATSGRLSTARFEALGRVLDWPPVPGPPERPTDFAVFKATVGADLPARYRHVAAPLGFNSADSSIPFRLAAAGRLALDPLGGLGFTASDLRKELAAMARADCLLIPSQYAGEIPKATPGHTAGTLWVPSALPLNYDHVTLFPMTFRERNPYPNLEGLLAAYVKEHYRPAGTWGGYVVYVPRDGAGA